MNTENISQSYPQLLLFPVVAHWKTQSLQYSQSSLRKRVDELRVRDSGVSRSVIQQIPVT